MNKIIWTNGVWEIDNKGVIWLCGDVVKRNVQIPLSIFKKRDEIMKYFDGESEE